MEEDNLEETPNQEEFEGNLEDLMDNEDFKGIMMDYLLFFSEYIKTTNEEVYKRAAEYASDQTGFVLLDFEIREDLNSEEEFDDE
jgi:hypothetical protein